MKAFLIGKENKARLFEGRQLRACVNSVFVMRLSEKFMIKAEFQTRVKVCSKHIEVDFGVTT
jgi:hypothetical protein